MFTVEPLPLASNGRITPEAYATIAPWWESRGGEAPTLAMLPACSALVSRNGKPIAVAFMYFDATGSGVAWLAWLATCPNESGHATGRAVLLAIDFLAHHARELNYWLLTATYHHPSIIKTLKRCGFLTGDRGMTQLFKPIK